MKIRSRSVAITLSVSSILTLAGLASLSLAPGDENTEAEFAQRVAVGSIADQAVAMPPRMIGLQIELGLTDDQPEDWEGEVEVSEGRVLKIDVVRSAAGARVEGNRFRAGSDSALTKKKAAAKKKAVAKKKAAAKNQPAIVAATVRVLLDAPLETVVTMRTDRGQFSFSPGKLLPGARQTFLDGEASAERIEASVALTDGPTEDDYPGAAKSRDGTVWVAYVEYRPDRRRLVGPVEPAEFDELLVPRRNGDRIRLRKFDGKTWSPAINVTEGGLEIWRPTVAVDGEGAVWVAWAQRVGGNWDIYARRYTPDRGGGQGTMSNVVRLSSDAGSDFHVVSATDSRGVVWLAWQAWRGGNYDVMSLALADGHPWREPRAISGSRANDWSPAIATDSHGGVFVAWDTYDQGNYDVRLRQVGTVADTITIAASPRFEARCSLACDGNDRLWIAYEEGDEQWGKDYANANPELVPVQNGGYPLYEHRTVRVKCLVSGKLMQPSGSLEGAWGHLRLGKSLPRIAADARGGIWLLVRHHPLPGGAGEVWHSFALYYNGQSWSAPRHLIDSAGLIDNRPVLLPVDREMLVVHGSDRRINTSNRGQFDIFAARLDWATGQARPPDLVPDSPAPAATIRAVHPREQEDIARMRNHRVDSAGTPLQLLRGEFHRHTEISSHRDADGLLEDSWRYALDAADLDWMGNGDHMSGFNFEYMWWFIQKMTDLHQNPPGFVAALTYERSALYPNGHRNVMMPRRGIRPLPFGDLQGTPAAGTPDTKILYAYLKHFGGICAAHTSATDMGTDWRDNDPDVEPVVEIYQGHRHNYEHEGAPRSPTPATQIGGYEPAGFVWNALKKGYRLGFESSSDHISTHWSYGVVLAPNRSREALIEAFRKRHCYAATDNIILDVRSGEQIMGDVFETDKPPTLKIAVQGTATVTKLHVIRDRRYVLTTEPGESRLEFRYTDEAARPGESHYYYVRVEQADRNIAWASPMWITYKKP